MIESVYPDYYGVPRNEWGEGEWVNEPDRLQWVDKLSGYYCLIHRNVTGALCGYVSIPEQHCLHGIYYHAEITEFNDFLDHPFISIESFFDCHGGITFSGESTKEATENFGIGLAGFLENNLWWLGFDCGHAGDYCPTIEANYKKLKLPAIINLIEVPIYRNIDYVKSQCMELAFKLKSFDNLIIRKRIEKAEK